MVIFSEQNQDLSIEVRYDQNTLWLTLNQLSILFKRDKSVISRHLKKIFNEGELFRNSVVARNATTAADGKTYQVEFFNLDAIISVGYRVNSIQGNKFRIWATTVLKEKLLESVSAKNPVKDLLYVIDYIDRITEGKELEREEASGLLKVITHYTHALDILDQYDHQQIEIISDQKESIPMDIAEIRGLIASMRFHFCAGNLFGLEKDGSLESSLSTIFQTFNGKELYPTPEIKAANLLYFLVKNHSFTDGNKRIAAAIFIYFLHRNNILATEFGRKIIDNNTLVALTLMLAESDPKDREMLVKVIVNLLTKH